MPGVAQTATGLKQFGNIVQNRPRGCMSHGSFPGFVVGLVLYKREEMLKPVWDCLQLLRLVIAVSGTGAFSVSPAG